MDGILRSEIDTVHRLKELVISQIEAFYLTESASTLGYNIWFSKDNDGKFVAQAIALKEKGKQEKGKEVERAAEVDCLFAGRSTDGFVGALENLWGLVLVHVSANAPSAGMVVG